jgi:hypothetical protein
MEHPNSIELCRELYELNVIRHQEERIEPVSVKSAVPIVQDRQYHLGEFPAAHMQRTAGTQVQQPIHCHECLPGSGPSHREEMLDAREDCRPSRT